MFSFLSKSLGGFFDIVRGIKKLDNDSLEKISHSMMQTLIDADVPQDIAFNFVELIKSRCHEVKLKSINAEEFVSKQIYDEMISLFNKARLKENDIFDKIFKLNKKNFIMTVCGLQGAGKTTTISKIIYYLIHKKKIKNIDIGVFSLDYYRPAAREQLKILCDKFSVGYYEKASSSILENAQELIKKVSSEKKIIIIDTAGRLAVDSEMMNELESIQKVVSPDLNFLVFDIMTGQQGLSIAEAFKKTVKIDGIILTKVESNSPGGVVLGISQKLAIPLLFMGYGEKPEDFCLFDPVRMTKLLLGMGDILGLVETAEKKLSAYDQDVIDRVIRRGDIGFDDFVSLINSVLKMGPMKNIITQIPSAMVDRSSVTDEKINKLEEEFNNFSIMRNSMNKKERKYIMLVIENISRQKRIAQGSGLSMVTISGLLKKYESLKDQFKMLKPFMSQMNKFF